MARAERLPLLAAALSVLALAAPARAQEFAGGRPLTKEQFVAGLLDRLTTHEYFSRILVVQDRRFDPLLFLVQKPQVDSPDFVERAVSTRAAWLRKLGELFQEQYVEPLGLQRRGDTPLQVVAVLQTLGDYTNYMQKVVDVAPNVADAHYERRLRTEVVFHEGHADGELERRNRELAVFVRALLQAHYGGGGGEVEQSWIPVGLGGYLAAHTGDTPAALDARVLDPAVVDLVADTLRDPTRRATYLVPLETLVGLGNVDSWFDALHKLTAAAMLPDPDRGELLEAWRGQSVLWMHFLHDGEGGKHRKHLFAYLGSALRGDGGADALRRAFEGEELAALDIQMYRWLAQRYSELHAGQTLDPALVAKPFAPQPARGRTTPLSRPNPAAAKLADPAAALAVSPDDVPAAHGRALQQFRAGHVEEALAALEKLEPQVRGGPLEGRIARELARVKVWQAMRDAYFADALASGERLNLDVAGQRVFAKIERVEHGLVFFGENRAKVESAPLFAFKPFDIARLLPKKLTDLPEGWIRNYPAVLEGEDKLKRAGDAPEVVDLRADAQQWYPGVLRLGAAVQALDALAAAGRPKDASAAGACLASIAALRKTWGDLTLVDERREALQQLAAQAFDVGWEPKRLVEQFRGKLELLGEGRAKITYEFEDPRELEDWVKLPGYLPDWPVPDMLLATTPEHAKFGIVGGALAGRGALRYRLPLRFGLPILARYTFRCGGLPPNGATKSALMVAVCDDGANGYVGCEGVGGLRAVDVASRTATFEFPEPKTLDPKHDYAVELRVAGKRASTFVDGAPVKEGNIGPRNRGDVLIGIHSDAEYGLLRLEVEGALDLDVAHARWLGAQLAALGF